MSTLRPYAPKKVVATFSAYTITGFEEGTFIEASRASDNTRNKVGAQGDVGITLNADKTGTLTFTLMQTSESNRVLSAVQAAQDLSGELLRDNFTIEDPSGGMLCICKGCHIMTPPAMTFSDDMSPKTWVFFVEEMVFLGLPAGQTQGGATAARVAGVVDSVRTATEALLEKLNSENKTKRGLNCPFFVYPKED